MPKSLCISWMKNWMDIMNLHRLTLPSLASWWPEWLTGKSSGDRAMENILLHIICDKGTWPITIILYVHQFSSAAQSCLTLCDPMNLHCPSPTPGVHPNPCPLYQWCHPTISSSVIPSIHLPKANFPTPQTLHECWESDSNILYSWSHFKL